MTGRLGILVTLLGAVQATSVRAQDPENCLSCHRFRGLSRIDKTTGELRLFFCSAEYYTYEQGPHSRMRCTDCHERSEVERIPHQVETPVDCARTCHLSTATGFSIRFTHAPIAETLEFSAHAPQTLHELTFDPPLLRSGQSPCLYCHDQPVFLEATRSPNPSPCGVSTERCDTCHASQLVLPTAYFANHVASRFRQARRLKPLVQTCAVCHSDPDVVGQIESHDAVASYLHSFHGKAALLGSTQTATCVNCHASQTGDIHFMLGPEDAESPTNPVNLTDTCRSTECHPGAPPGLSRAAVHLELDPSLYAPEFVVAAGFVLLTAGVMIVYFILLLLELLNEAVRGRNPEYQRLVRLARKLQDTPEGRAALERMSPHERAQHWLLAISFILLVITGMPIKFADQQWAAKVVDLFGNLTAARIIHRICGVVLIGVFLYHVVYLFARLGMQVRTARRAGSRESIWRMIIHSPMVITPSDIRAFGQQFLYLLGLRRRRPTYGHMSFTQKFEYWAVFWGAPIMGMTGSILWGAPLVTEEVSGRALNFAFIIHSDEAYLAFIYIAVVHFFAVIFTPAVFPLSLGTLSGQVPPDELAEHHAARLEETARRLNIAVETQTSGGGLGAWIKGGIRRTYAAGLFALCLYISFVSMRFLIRLLFAHETTPVHVTGIPKRLDAQTLARAGTPALQPIATLGERRRGPLAHFHQIPTWFQADPRNSCTTSGCHAPLPHGERIEVRAFLNMHTTFVDCTVCHAESAADEQSAATPAWFALPSRERTDTPAVLRLAALLEAVDPSAVESPAELSEALMSLLRQALDEAGEDPQLRTWLIRLDTTHPASKIWRGIIEDLQQGIGLHVHGEYNAKIGLYDQGRPIRTPTAEQKQATRQYLSQTEALSESQRQTLLDKVHQGIAPIGAMCTPCHSPKPTLVDIAKLGYPPSRVQAMQESTIVRQVLRIEQGEPFYIPLDESQP